MFCVFLNLQFKLLYILHVELPSHVISFQNLNLEISKGRGLLTGEDLEIVLCVYNTMKMNSDDKFNVVIAF